MKFGFNCAAALKAVWASGMIEINLKNKHKYTYAAIGNRYKLKREKLEIHYCCCIICQWLKIVGYRVH